MPRHLAHGSHPVHQLNNASYKYDLAYLMHDKKFQTTSHEIGRGVVEQRIVIMTFNKLHIKYGRFKLQVPLSRSLFKT